METPRTLQQAIIHFSKPENCNTFMIAARWTARWTDGKARCPQCGSDNVIYVEKVAGMGLRERHGEVRTMVVPNVKRKSLVSTTKEVGKKTCCVESCKTTQGEINSTGYDHYSISF